MPLRSRIAVRWDVSGATVERRPAQLRGQRQGRSDNARPGRVATNLPCRPCPVFGALAFVRGAAR